MGAKTRVGQEHNGKIQYYGHFYGHNDDEIILKAYSKHEGILNCDLNKPFLLKKNFVEREVKYEG